MTSATPANAPVPRRRPQRVEAAHTKYSRPLWRWAAALPALLALASSVIMVLVIAGQTPGDVLQWYHTMGDRALQDKDYQLAVVCYQRLVADEAEDPSNEFKFALSLAGVGRQRDAIEMLARLTPEDGPGYAPARLVVARILLDTKPPTPQSLAGAERHLLRVLESEPMNSSAHAMLAALYADEGKWDLCKYHLGRSGELKAGLEPRIRQQMPPQTGPSS
jgi:tetratricopeptide (TPR) repeat protein